MQSLIKFKKEILFVFVITIFYSLFPKFSIQFILKKSEYLTIIPYLTFFSINLTIYSLLSVIANFYLAIKKIMIAFPIAAAAILQIFMIIFLHQNIQQVIIVSFSVNLLLFLILLFYYPIVAKSAFEHHD